MNRRIPTLVLAAVSMAACSEQLPVGPLESTGAAPLAKAVAGSYELTFLKNGQEVSTLPVGFGSGVILKAHVDDAFDVAASGSITFQYCSYKGRPPNDITRADEAPSAACADGSAAWANLIYPITLDDSGDAYAGFGIVQIPRTVGFRFKFAGKGTAIANGVSQPRDFTWVAAE